MNTENIKEFTGIAADTLMNKFPAEKLPPEGVFHYHQGVFLNGMKKWYNICNDERYMTYIKKWVDSNIGSDGKIKNYTKENLDDLQPCILLFQLYEETGDERYKKVIENGAYLIENWRKNPYGGFWHLKSTPDQMWLDGMYMGGPFTAEYASRFNKPELFDVVHKQMMLMREHMKDEKTGLLYHGWDSSKRAEWADTKTGCSTVFWGRSIGWYAVALADILDFIPEELDIRKDFEETLAGLLKAVAEYQDEKSGLWYQVVNMGNSLENWTEKSCSCLFAYAMAKAVRTGLLPDSFKENVRRAYIGVTGDLKRDESGILLDKICVGTGIAHFDYYVNRPTGINDLHGIGALLYMCTEYILMNK